MGIFLFAKQLVDMLYQFQWLDYMMVLFSLILFGYQIVLVRPNLKKGFNLTDVIVVLIALLTTITFVRSGEGYTVYFKVLSALLLYFIGRIYYDRILECTSSLVICSYIVVWINFIYRILKNGVKILEVTNAGGDFFYQDTDMAYGMIVSFIFIVMFGKNKWYKVLTAFVVIPYMVFYSDAGIQKILLVASFAIFIIYVYEWVFELNQVSNILLIIVAMSMLFFVVMTYWPLLTSNIDYKISSAGVLDNVLSSDNMRYRFEVWGIALKEILSSNPLSIMFGLDMGVHYEISSMYVKVFYTIGIVGVILSISFIVSIIYHVFKVKDRRTYYISYLMILIFLGGGATVNCMETVQMSWFPFLFAGMVVSSVHLKRNKEISYE